MHRGYIKLWRKTFDNPFMRKAKVLSLWVHLLLSANHKERDELIGGERITCKAGQFTTGRKQLSLELGIAETTIERILNIFEKEGQIGQRKTSVNRLITIVNWKQYQQDGQRMDNERTSNGQRMDTLKECKNDKNVKNKANPFFWEFKKLYPNCLAFKRTQGAFNRLNPDEALWGVMRKALLEQKESKSWKQGYVPASFKWLEEERWKDTVSKKVECPF